MAVEITISYATADAKKHVVKRELNSRNRFMMFHDISVRKRYFIGQDPSEPQGIIFESPDYLPPLRRNKCNFITLCSNTRYQEVARLLPGEIWQKENGIGVTNHTTVTVSYYDKTTE